MDFNALTGSDMDLKLGLKVSGALKLLEICLIISRFDIKGGYPCFGDFTRGLLKYTKIIVINIFIWKG